MNLWIKIYSFLYWGIFALICIPFFLLNFVIYILTLPFDRNGFILHMSSCVWAMLVFWINPFWRIHIQGRHHIQWHKPYVIVSNHQSNFDIILFGLFRHFKWLSKESLKKIPTVGWNMVMNRYIFIDRKNPQSRRKGLKQCRDWLKRGISVLIFPEGTRSKTGDLGDFQLGAFRMALKENVPLLPVVINGTQGILKKHSFYLSAGRKDIFVKVLEPVPSDKFQADQAMEFQIAVKKKMASALEELR